MSETKHTPGPCEQLLAVYENVENGAEEIAEAYAKTAEWMRRHAKLADSAPRLLRERNALLEAAQALVVYYDERTSPDTADMDRFRAAIDAVNRAN